MAGGFNENDARTREIESVLSKIKRKKERRNIARN